MNRSVLFVPLFAFALNCTAMSAPAAEAVEVTEWVVPWSQSRPRDPWVALFGTDRNTLGRALPRHESILPLHR